MITLFHGSYTEVTNPLVKLGRTKVDFGQGFYLTKLLSQAEAWALVIAERRQHANAIVSSFAFDVDGLAKSNYHIKKSMHIILNGLNMSLIAVEALGQLKYKVVNHQLCILNQDIADKFLTFVSSKIVNEDKL